MPSLEGRTFVITRPKHQSLNLKNLIVNAGGNAICFPVIEIGDIEDSNSYRPVLDRLDEYDMAIFISVNAVTKGIPILQSRGTFSDLRIAAVGQATQKALFNLGIKTDIFPQTHYNSEALLELQSLHHVANKKIIIFRGQGGREHLAETLKKRGAYVDYIDCYRRQKAPSNPQDLLRVWRQNHIDAFIVTSIEGLKNLYDIVGIEGRHYLLNDQLIVFSQRIANYATELNFIKAPFVTKAASDDATIELIFTKFSH